MSTEIPPFVAQTKTWRRSLDETLQDIRRSSERGYTGFRPPDHPVRPSRERSLAITKLQEAILWLGMDLKDQNEPNPYPESYNPASPRIEPTSEGLKL